MRRIVSSLRGDLLWLTMTGGEPTLKLHVAETVNDIYDDCPHLGFITVNTNAIIPDHLLHPTGVFKERLSQAALYYETTQVDDDEARPHPELTALR